MAGISDVFEVSRASNQMSVRFSSSLSRIDRVCDTVIGFLESQGTPSCHMFGINLVLREGLTNAVRHGNQNDPAKLVILCLRLGRGSCLKVSIEDQGRGFDWRAACRTPVGEAEDHGRGILIMDTYFDRYRYNEKGNTLYLEKNVRPPAGKF